jgi:TRAP-type C4-dicarboxylate transport system permease small subunit
MEKKSEMPQQQETDAENNVLALDRWVIKLSDWVMWLFVVAVLISFYEVIMRYFFDSPTVWVHETTTAIVGMAMAYGGIYCYSKDSHIKVTLVADMLPPKAKKTVDIFINFLVLAFAVTGFYAMYFVTYRAVLTPDGGFYLQRSGSAMNSAWPTFTKIFILLVFSILILQALMHLFVKIRDFNK